MYEELLKWLRAWEKSDVSNWRTFKEAADAIEEAEMNIRHLERDYKELCSYLPKWIPVTEKLPEKAYGCLAIVWDNNPYTGDVFLNYYPEFVGYDSGTWNDCDGEAIPLDVVYWMKMPKIPEPPKEET